MDAKTIVRLGLAVFVAASLIAMKSAAGGSKQKTAPSTLSWTGPRHILFYLIQTDAGRKSDCSRSPKAQAVPRL